MHVAGCDGRKEEKRERDEHKGRVREEFTIFPELLFSPKENLTASNMEMPAPIFAHMYNLLGISMEDKPYFKHLYVCINTAFCGEGIVLVNKL